MDAPATAEGIEIVVNGEPRRAGPESTIESFLIEHGLDPDLVVVERNRVIAPRPTYAATRLSPGDQLEIVHFVGGG